MRNTFTSLLLLASVAAWGQHIEQADEAVKHMRVGWNLGNTLDSHSGDTQNMWIELYTDCSPKAYETAWGQPQATPELMAMLKDAGFGAIRVPVTWYPHIDAYGNVDKEWMARVHEVVDYVIDQGMYCILNVHHDTGAANTHWLVASTETYSEVRERYENLWTQIAQEFAAYDGHLLFEAYNEMLDKANSWCYASFGTANKYDATMATDAYEAINRYAQSFVDAVRATGGNNAERNLIVNTYGACSDEGTWSNHLTEPLTHMTLPNDATSGHLIFEVHTYPSLDNGVASAVNATRQTFKALKTHLASKGAPVVIGEWGTLSTAKEGDEAGFNERLTSFAGQFEALAKEEGFTTFYWMGLTDGADRSVPQWTMPSLKDAIIEGYYGPEGYTSGISELPTIRTTSEAIYNMQGMRIARPTRGLYISGGKKKIAGGR